MAHLAQSNGTRPFRAPFREGSFREALALDVGPGLMAALVRGQQPTPGAFSMFFDCPEPMRFEPAEVGTDGVAVLRVQGPLENRASWLWHSYETLIECATAAIECSAVRALVLKIDSPGGAAAGMADTHRELRRLAGRKPIYAWCQQGCSAAYNIASACSEVWLPEDGELGSIGVILCTVDETAALKAAGVAVHYVVTGARKADLHPGTTVSPEVLAVAQRKVDQLGAIFFNAAGPARGLKPAYVKALEAATFIGQDAAEIGLADGVAPWLDFLDFVRLAQGATVGTLRAAQPAPVAQPSTLRRDEDPAAPEDEGRSGRARGSGAEGDRRGHDRRRHGEGDGRARASACGES